MDATTLVAAAQAQVEADPTASHLLLLPATHGVDLLDRDQEDRHLCLMSLHLLAAVERAGMVADLARTLAELASAERRAGEAAGRALLRLELRRLLADE